MTLPVAAENLLERLAEVLIEDRIQNGVNSRITVAQPEEDGVELTRNMEAITHNAAQQICGEEADPEAAEEGDDDGHPDGGFGLAILPPLLLTNATRRLRTLNDALQFEVRYVIVALFGFSFAVTISCCFLGVVSALVGCSCYHCCWWWLCLHSRCLHCFVVG